MAQISYGTITVSDITDRGISGVVEYYAKSSNSATAPATTAFSSSVDAPTSSEPYLWNYEVISYTDNSTPLSTTPHIAAVYGATGRGISSITDYYTISSSGTTAPGWAAFGTNVVAPTSTSRFLWNYEKTVYTSGTPASTSSNRRVIGVYGEQGVAGPTGPTGANGINTATVHIYAKATSESALPALPTIASYTFSSSELSLPTGCSWYSTVPTTGSGYVWIRAATAASTAVTDTIPSSEWSVPIQLEGTAGASGSNGTNGLNQATVYLYARASSAPSKPSGSLKYTFSNGSLASPPSPWGRSIPTTTGNPCWVTTAVAISSASTYSIPSTGWSDITKLVEDGNDGISPTVSKTGNTVTITDADGNVVTVTDGANGTSYYTYVRYADDSSGTNMSASPSGKTYIGVYSGTSPTVPTNPSSFTWSKYVGTNGVSVTKVVPIYYLKVNTTPTTPANGTTINSTSTGSDVWTTVVPTYVNNGIYYISYQTFLSSGTSPISSTAVIDNALTTANSNAAAAVNTANTAASNASAAVTTANAAVKFSWPIYYRTNSSKPNKPTTIINNTSDDEDNTWTLVMPKPKKNFAFYTCNKQQLGDGTINYTDVQAINSATYISKWCNSTDNTFIDGGAIYGKSLTLAQISENDTDTNNAIFNSVAISSAKSYTDSAKSTLQTQITQNASAIELKVSQDDFNGNNIISKINLDSTTATISADKINIAGAAIFTSGRLSTNSLNSAYDAKGAATSAASAALSSATEYTNTALNGYSTTSAMNSAISSALTAYPTTGAMNSAISSALTAYPTTAAMNSAISGVNSNAVYRAQQIYQRTTSSGAPNQNFTWLSPSGTGYGNWSLSVPSLINYNTNPPTKYPYLYTATQTQTIAQYNNGSGTDCNCSSVVLDDTTTVIDGGNIITGTITTNQISTDGIAANKIKLYGQMDVYTDNSLAITGGYLGYTPGLTKTLNVLLDYSADFQVGDLKNDNGDEQPQDDSDVAQYGRLYRTGFIPLKKVQENGTEFQPYRYRQLDHDKATGKYFFYQWDGEKYNSLGGYQGSTGLVSIPPNATHFRVCGRDRTKTDCGAVQVFSLIEFGYWRYALTHGMSLKHTTDTSEHYIIVTEQGIRLQEHLGTKTTIDDVTQWSRNPNLYLSNGELVSSCRIFLDPYQGVNDNFYTPSINFSNGEKYGSFDYYSIPRAIYTHDPTQGGQASGEYLTLFEDPGNFNCFNIEIAWNSGDYQRTRASTTVRVDNDYAFAVPAITWYGTSYIAAAMRRVKICTATSTVYPGYSSSYPNGYIMANDSGAIYYASSSATKGPNVAIITRITAWRE